MLRCSKARDDKITDNTNAQSWYCLLEEDGTRSLGAVPLFQQRSWAVVSILNWLPWWYDPGPRTDENYLHL